LGNKINTTDKSEFAEAHGGQNADVVVMVLGHGLQSGEKQVGYWFTRSSARIIGSHLQS
jgi:hypothetical protein